MHRRVISRLVVVLFSSACSLCEVIEMVIPEAPLRFLSDAAGFSPIPGVQAAVNLVIDIIKTVDNVKGSKKEFLALQNDVTTFALALVHAGEAIRNPRMQDYLEAFTKRLEDIKALIAKQTGVGVFKRTVFQDEIKEQIKAHRSDVTQQYQVFSVSVLTITFEMLELERSERHAEHGEIMAALDAAVIGRPAPSPVFGDEGTPRPVVLADGGQPVVRVATAGQPRALVGPYATVTNTDDVAKEDRIAWEGEIEQLPLAELQHTVKEAYKTWSEPERAQAIVNLQARFDALKDVTGAAKSAEGLWIRYSLLCLRFFQGGWYDALVQHGQELAGFRNAMRSEREDVYQRMVSAGILDRNTKSDWNGEPTAKPLLRWLDDVQDVTVIEVVRRIIVASSRNTALLLVDRTPDKWNESLSRSA